MNPVVQEKEVQRVAEGEGEGTRDGVEIVGESQKFRITKCNASTLESKCRGRVSLTFNGLPIGANAARRWNIGDGTCAARYLDTKYGQRWLPSN